MAFQLPCVCLVTQSCLTLCNPMDCSLPAPWGFSRQEYWSGLPCPPSEDLPNPGIKATSPAPQADSLLSEPPGKPPTFIGVCNYVTFACAFCGVGGGWGGRCGCVQLHMCTCLWRGGWVVVIIHPGGKNYYLMSAQYLPTPELRYMHLP